jgi:U3 small nucleolar RNA-associated protein 21
VSQIHFLANEPILITSSQGDNSLKVWFFEKGTTQPRILRERSGHAAPPIRVRFYGGKDDPVNQGARNVITSAGDGSLRDISLLNEFQSMKFSIKQLVKKGTEQGEESLGGNIK